MSRVPAATVSRLVTYFRILSDLEAQGVEKTSSDDLAVVAGVSAFQVRKDLAYFGRFGTRGTGYKVPTLLRRIRGILGLTRTWNVAIMGAGRLGQALADFPKFGEHGFVLKAGFDADPAKVGMRIGAAEVYGLDALAQKIQELEIDMAFLTVPTAAAQPAVDLLVEAGIRGILNFVPSVITVPAHVFVEPVDFLAGVKRLAFYIQKMSPEEGTP